MSIQLHITKLCAPRTGFTAQPGPAGPAGLGGLFGASRVGRGGAGVASMVFGPGREAVQDDASSHLLGGNDSSFASDRSSDSALEFDYKSFDYNRIHCPWRSCFA
jgi:hypothetical protein